jgi:heat shock protein HslJ
MQTLKRTFPLLTLLILLVALAACANPTEPIATPTPDTSTSGPNEPADTTLVNDWLVISINGNQVETGVVPTLSFTNEGVVSGEGGCNGFGGTYTTDESNGIVLTGMTATLIACEDEAVMAQEAALMDALNQTTVYLIEGNTLTLTDEMGTALVVLNRDA